MSSKGFALSTKRAAAAAKNAALAAANTTTETAVPAVTVATAGPACKHCGSTGHATRGCPQKKNGGASTAAITADSTENEKADEGTEVIAVKETASAPASKGDESGSSDDDDDVVVTAAVNAATAGIDSFSSPSGLLTLSGQAAIAAAASVPVAETTTATTVPSSTGLLISDHAAHSDEPPAKRHKSKWSRDVTRLIGRHIPFQQYAPYSESGNTRNLIRGYCKMCTRKVTICCKKCHVYLCIEVLADSGAAASAAAAASDGGPVIPTEKSCWEVFHTEEDPDVFMNKSVSNKKQERIARAAAAAAAAAAVAATSVPVDDVPVKEASQPVGAISDDDSEVSANGKDKKRARGESK